MAGPSSSACCWRASAARNGRIGVPPVHKKVETNTGRPDAYPTIMDAQDAINLTQQAMLTALLISAPILLVGVLVGLLIGLAQALTQVQDQTVAFVPKLVAMVAVLVLCLPWLVQKMVEYSESLITNIPRSIMGG